MRRPLLRAAAVLAVLILLVGGGGFAVLAGWRGPAVAWRELGGLRWRWLALSLVAVYASLACQAARWRALVPGTARPGLLAITVVQAGANVLHMSIPGPAGELAAALVLWRRWNVPIAVAFGSALAARLVALGVLAAVAIVLAPWAAEGLPAVARGWVAVAGAACAIGLTALLALARSPGAAVSAIAAVARVLGPARAARVRARLEEALDGLRALGQLGARRWAEALVWSLLSTLALGAAAGCAFAAAGVELSALHALFGGVLVALAGVASMIAPGGFGALETVSAAVVVWLGAGSFEQAVLAVVALRWSQLLSMALGTPALGWILAHVARDLEERGMLGAGRAAPPEGEGDAAG